MCLKIELSTFNFSFVHLYVQTVLKALYSVCRIHFYNSEHLFSLCLPLISVLGFLQNHRLDVSVFSSKLGHFNWLCKIPLLSLFSCKSPAFIKLCVQNLLKVCKHTALSFRVCKIKFTGKKTLNFQAHLFK